MHTLFLLQLIIQFLACMCIVRPDPVFLTSPIYGCPEFALDLPQSMGVLDLL